MIVLAEKVRYERKSDKDGHESDSDRVECLLSATSFKFSKVVWSRDDGESCAFWLEHDDDSNDNRYDDEKSMDDLHKWMGEKVIFDLKNTRLLYKKNLFLQIFGFFRILW